MQEGKEAAAAREADSKAGAEAARESLGRRREKRCSASLSLSSSHSLTHSPLESHAGPLFSLALSRSLARCLSLSPVLLALTAPAANTYTNTAAELQPQQQQFRISSSSK